MGQGRDFLPLQNPYPQLCVMQVQYQDMELELGVGDQVTPA